MRLRASKRLEKGDEVSRDDPQLPKTYNSEPPMRKLFPRRKRQLLPSADRKRLRTFILSAISALIGYVILVAVHHVTSLASRSSPQVLVSDHHGSLDIVFQEENSPSKHRTIQRPPDIGIYDKLDAQKPDHGGLDLRLLQEVERRQEPRSIYVDYGLQAGYEDLINGPNDDDWREGYFAIDDDVERNPLAMWDDDTIQEKRRCRRTSWHRDMFPTCNVMHEYDTIAYMRDDETRFVGSGAFRTVFLTTDRNLKDSTVLKTLTFDLAFNFEHYEYMRMDGLISEKLTSSQRIVDNYAFCGLSMISEALHHGSLMDVAVPKGGYLSEPVADMEELLHRSPLSPERKLQLALDMVEAVATIHSYPGGVVVHDDIQLSQLNDFNRAEIMLFDQENQEYCRYRNNPGMGDWRSPEEYDNRPLNEKIDVWSLGNNMYSILTGLFPFYESKDVALVKSKVQNGETGYIDPRYAERSIAEARLAEVVQLCWVYDVDVRPNIFTIRDMLRRFVQEHPQVIRQRSSPLLIKHSNSTRVSRLRR